MKDPFGPGGTESEALLPAGLAVLGSAPDAIGSAQLLAPGCRKFPHSLRMHHPMPSFFFFFFYTFKWVSIIRLNGH